jgi:hypothetical protein
MDDEDEQGQAPAAAEVPSQPEAQVITPEQAEQAVQDGWKPGDPLPESAATGDSAGTSVVAAQQSARGLLPDHLRPGDYETKMESSNDGPVVLVASPGTAGKPMTGLYVEPALRGTYGSMKEKSPIFRQAAETLENAPDALHVIKIGDTEDGSPAQSDCDKWGGGCVITIDPDKLSQRNYVTKDGGEAPLTLERAIAHEVRHAQVSEQTPAPLKRVPWAYHSAYIDSENSMMNEIDPTSPDRKPDDSSLPLKKK